MEAKVLKAELATIPNHSLVSLDADSYQGYYDLWKKRKKLEASGDEEALKGFDKAHPNAEYGNFSHKQLGLLNEYWSRKDKDNQAEFLKKHEAEIGVNLRDKYLRSHAKENAQLAIWEQANILTPEAYTHFKTMVEELDIPDNGLPERTLPPETSLETHWSYLGMVSEGTHTGVAADLLLLKDQLAADEADMESYTEWRGRTGQPLSLTDKP